MEPSYEVLLSYNGFCFNFSPLAIFTTSGVSVKIFRYLLSGQFSISGYLCLPCSMQVINHKKIKILLTLKIQNILKDFQIIVQESTQNELPLSKYLSNT